MVAFKENRKPPGSPGMDAGGEGFIKAHTAGGPGASGAAACPARVAAGPGSSRGAAGGAGQDPALMGRRAMVAAAALSGRTTSGLSDVQAEVMLTATPRAVLGEHNRTPSPLSQRQQAQQPPLGHADEQQSDGGSSPSASSQSLASLAVQPLLGRARSTSASPAAGQPGAAGDRQPHGRALPR